MDKRLHRWLVIRWLRRYTKRNGIISTDVFSAYCDGTQIGESAMVVIGSMTGKYGKTEVMGKSKYKIYSATADGIGQVENEQMCIDIKTSDNIAVFLAHRQ